MGRTARASLLLALLLLPFGCKLEKTEKQKPVSISSLPPREQMNAVLDESCRTALHFLDKSQEFYPFAIAMDKGGAIRHVAGYTGTEMPASSDVIEVMVAGLKEDVANGRLLAVGIVKDVRITDPRTGTKTDAIAVALEHRSDQPVTCYLPYSFEGDRLIQGEIVAERGQANVFAPDA